MNNPRSVEFFPHIVLLDQLRDRYAALRERGSQHLLGTIGHLVRAVHL